MNKNLLVFIYIVYSHLIFGQNICSEQSVIDFQAELNEYYRNPESSPLVKEDLAQFEALPFFEYNPNWCIEAKLVRTPDEKPFKMPTSTDRLPWYVKYGQLHFTVDGKSFVLDVFQNLDLAKNPLYKNKLFLPFTDLTSGVETYGGGRYIDLDMTDGDTMIVDFNKSYHPLCAYNYKYSCPIPPEQNNLEVRVIAGVRL